jgi:hypothetical protein
VDEREFLVQIRQGLLFLLDVVEGKLWIHPTTAQLRGIHKALK